MLLCFDGLGQAFPEPEELAWRLVLEANRHNGSDNISGGVVTAADVITWQARFMGTTLASLLRDVVAVS